MLRNKNKKQNRTRVVKANIALLVSLVLIILLNLITSNYAASKKYETAQYVREYDRLRDETQQLTVSVAELRSIDRVDRERERLNLVAVQAVHYIAAKGPVALNR